MAKTTAQIAVAFAAQAADGVFPTAFENAIDLGTMTTADGLVLGDPESGVFESGLDYTYARASRDAGRIPGSFTRPLSNFLLDEASTFSFAMPFCGNRASPAGAPAAGDTEPIPGMQALLAGAFLANTPSGATNVYKYATGTFPFSAVVWANGTKWEWKDCRCSLSIVFEAANIPILTADIQAGSSHELGVRSNIAASLPGTLDFDDATGNQLVSAPTVVSVDNQWSSLRGYDTCTLALAPSFEDIGDSNEETGRVREISDIETNVSATFYKDSTTQAFEGQQVTETQHANLVPYSFTVPRNPAGDTAAVAGQPVTAVGISLPAPEATEEQIANLGTKAASTMNLIARSDTAGEELSITFL